MFESSVYPSSHPGFNSNSSGIGSFITISAMPGCDRESARSSKNTRSKDQNRKRSAAPNSRGAENVLSAKPIPMLELPEIR